jgi:hemerythrin-like domain-containing protein
MIKNANGYANLLLQHIKKENVIFPRWINPLSDLIKEGLFDRFEDIEEKVIGLGKHQEYVLNIEKLKNSL